jgi:hypothetical protein
MPICNILEHPHQNADHAEQIRAHIRSSGPVLPEGSRLVIAGPAETGYRVISVWDSLDARDQFFAERLAAAYEDVGLSLQDATQTYFDVEALMAGDLTGAAVA